jgi:predicted amidohydrolase YtcJ
MLPDLPDEIPGGEIIRDPGMGVLCDAAAILVENLAPIKSDEEIEALFKAAMKDLNSVGLVGVHEANVIPRTLKIYKRLESLLSPAPARPCFSRGLLIEDSRKMRN